MRLLLVGLLLATSLTAQSHSATLIWAWTQGTGDPATGFHVQRSATVSGPFTILATIPSITTLTYIDTTVIGGQTYTYMVTAFNSGGESVPSNLVTCVVPFQAPTPPSGLSATVK